MKYLKHPRLALIAHSIDVALQRRWINRLALIAVICWAFISTVGFSALVYQQFQNHQATQKSQYAAQIAGAVKSSEVHNCAQIEKIKTVIRQIFDQSIQQLGKPGSAGYDYYHAHPLELAAAKAATEAQKQKFAAESCS